MEPKVNLCIHSNAHCVQITCTKDAFFSWCLITHILAHGDQPLEVMARDKRYSHYMGRPFAHFDSHGYHPDLFGKTNAQPFYSPYRRTPPKKGKGSTLQLRPISAGGGSGGAKKTSKNTLLTKEERKLERERHKKNSLSASDALLRLSFTGHRENETDYLYRGGMREGI